MLKEGEVGKGIYVSAGYDLNDAPFTELTLTFRYPATNTSFTRNTADGVTAPAVDSPNIPGVGVLPANTYALYTTQATDDFTAGEWTCCLAYEDAAPTLLYGDDGAFTVGESC